MITVHFTPGDSANVRETVVMTGEWPIERSGRLRSFEDPNRARNITLRGCGFSHGRILDTIRSSREKGGRGKEESAECSGSSMDVYIYVLVVFIFVPLHDTRGIPGHLARRNFVVCTVYSE